jgi:hypothetical protein
VKAEKPKFIFVLVMFILFITTHSVFAFYNPEIGRWANRDPIGEQGGINLYRYTENNPISFWDMLGLDSQNCPCTREKIEAEKNQLLTRYREASDIYLVRGVPHHGCGSYSCDNVNYPILNYLASSLACWSCSEEHRSLYISGWVPIYGNHYYDHWAVVCVSKDKAQSMLFDYWGDRPPGEDPAEWFDKKFNLPGPPPGNTDWYHYPSPQGPFPNSRPVTP